MTGTGRTDLTLFRLWLPTVFGASMLVVEIPLVSAAAARSVDGGRALAAIGIGMSILVVVNSPALAMAGLVATEWDRRTAKQLRRYTLAVGCLGTAVLFGLAVPPGSAAVRALFDLDAGLAGAVSAFLAGLALNSLGVAVRRYQHGRLIHARATRPIVWATIVRLATTAAIAWVGVTLAPDRGPFIAGAALTVGAFLEAAALQVATSRFPAQQWPARTSTGWTGLAASHGNLSAGRLLVMAPTVITTVAVAHATRAPDSLIVWPVLIQFAALFTSPTTDWESVAATALRADRGTRAPRRLTIWLATAVTVLFAVGFASGTADLFVRELLAVPDRAADLGLRWAWILLPLPAAWLTRAYLRGAVMAHDATRWLSYAALVHVFVLVGLLLLLVPTALPGVACAATALTAGVLAETVSTLLGKARSELTTRPAGTRGHRPPDRPESRLRSPDAPRGS
jgi:hypothetical protein